MKCSLCNKEKEIAQGVHQTLNGSFFNLRITVREAICEDCRERLFRAMFDVGTAIVWNRPELEEENQVEFTREESDFIKHLMEMHKSVGNFDHHRGDSNDSKENDMVEWAVRAMDRIDELEREIRIRDGDT